MGELLEQPSVGLLEGDQIHFLGKRIMFGRNVFSTHETSFSFVDLTKFNSVNTSSVCSPGAGAWRRTSNGSPSTMAAEPTYATGPATGCTPSTNTLRRATWGSAATSATL